MGLNAYFTYNVVLGMHVPWQTALGCVFLSGVAFLLLTLVGIRRLIVQAIPRPLLAAVAAGIGLFLAFIGLQAAGIVVAHRRNHGRAGRSFGTADPGRDPDPGVDHDPAGLARARCHSDRHSCRHRRRLGGRSRAAASRVRSDCVVGDALQLDVGAALHIGGSLGVGLIEIFFVFLFVDLFDNVARWWR